MKVRKGQVSDGTGIHKPGSAETLSTPRRRSPARTTAEKKERHREAQRSYKERKALGRSKVRKAAAKLALVAENAPADAAPAAPAAQVEHPNHYNRGAIETWDYTTDQGMGFLEGNVVKYVSRWRHKDGVSDLEKARAYLDKLIQVAKDTPSVDNAVHYRPT